ncbi:hypothetical protein AUR04nite_22300 [Glutamicibacter uratoxydans]|uniref:FHA domain-containing protein n=1 Tax=Glutamicibacter uratoxydans TaxID=43667 RepID=A0A4Y4DTL5_GLUUR|nr:FHA domain-containing protein [Glutamicibacter uratoxydans]GED06698.1 hypothetical protein AUR04nite_22300 [Glutamicibacter uratoxydans]
MNTLRYLPGDWYALVSANHVVVLPPDTAADTVKSLWDAMDGTEDLETLLSALLGTVGMKITAMPDFAMVSRAKAPHVMVRGAVQFNYTDERGSHQISASGIATWTEQRCSETSAWSLDSGAVQAEAAAGPVLHITEGMVLASKLSFGSEQTAAAGKISAEAQKVIDEAVEDARGRRAADAASEAEPEETQLAVKPAGKRAAEPKKQETAAAAAPATSAAPKASATPAQEPSAPAVQKKAVSSETPTAPAPDAKKPEAAAPAANELATVAMKRTSANLEPNADSARQQQGSKKVPAAAADDADTMDPEAEESSGISEEVSLASILLGKRDDPSTQYQTEEPDNADTIIKARASKVSVLPENEEVDNEDTVYSTSLRSRASAPAQPAAEPEMSTISSHQMILARVCSGGHPNPPESTSCRTCHVKLSGQATRVRQPSMGRMFVTEQSSGPGSTHLLTRSVIIGRQPVYKGPAGASEPKLMKVLSPNNDISRSHVQVKIDGWHVELVDLGATNGTVLLREGQSPRRLGTKEAVLLLSGDVADLGDGVTLSFKDLP